MGCRPQAVFRLTSYPLILSYFISSKILSNLEKFAEFKSILELSLGFKTSQSPSNPEI